MWFFTVIITTKTDVTQMVEASVLRTILQVLLVCWQKRNSLTGFSIVGSDRTVENASMVNVPTDQPHQETQDENIPHWLAAPIEEKTF